MSRKLALALLLAGLLVAAPLAARAADDAAADDAAAADEEYDDEDEAAGDAGAAKGDDEKDVVVIGDKNWTETVGKSKFALVEFYAPWCGHCQRLKPEWAKAATAIKAHDDAIVVGKVDATVDPDMAKKFGVSGYPTIKWFVDGELVSDYGGPREADGIARWIKKKTGPAAATLADAAALTAAEKDAAVLVVGYFKDLKGAEYEAFTKAAQKTEDAVFAQTTDAAAAKAAGISGGPPGFSVVANHPNEDRATAPGGKKVTAEAVEALLKANKLPVVVPFNDENSSKIFGSGIEKQVLLVAKSGDLDHKAGGKSAKAFRAAAAGFRGKLTFVAVDVESKSAAPVTNFFGVKAEDAPMLLGFEMSANKKYKYAGDLTSEKAVKKFADDLLADKLAPEYKSAPVPESLLDDEGVAVVVGKNFDAVVKDAKKDVLLEVYAPWCGHCKQLAPIYAKLAKRFAKVESVVVAKMDGTENEHPEVEVKGYPSLVFYPADKAAKPVTYDGGDRSLKAMTKFIKKHAKVAYELPKKDKADKDAGDDDTKAKDDKAEEEEEVKDEL